MDRRSMTRSTQYVLYLVFGLAAFIGGLLLAALLERAERQNQVSTLQYKLEKLQDRCTDTSPPFFQVQEHQGYSL